MELECDSVKCGICCTQSAKLLSLSEQERALVEKLFQCISLCKTSDFACDLCRFKLWNFNIFFEEIIVNRIKLEKTHERKMHEESNKIQEEDKTEEPHIDSYNCKCSNCQTKFGSLPLLVDVIEQNEEKTEIYTNEPMPSTSRDTPTGSPRKSMNCIHCGKEFTHKGDLNKHVRKHTGEQPYTCNICDRKFAHNSNLVRHSRLHTGDRPFKCDICNKYFYRKDKLELHRRKSKCKKD